MQQRNATESAETNVVLRGPSWEINPDDAVHPGHRESTALSLFQSFLCNPSEDRGNLSNVILLWEQIPRFTGDRLNRKKELPNEWTTTFEINGHPFQLSILPGTYHKVQNGEKTAVRRYPGIREQAVEQALIQIASDQAQCSEEDGTTHYYVHFSIRQLAIRLKAMGSTMSHGQIRAALEVLNSANMGLSVLSGKRTIRERTPIIPLFRQRYDDEDRAAGTDEWVVRLHYIITHAIRNVTYRQFPIHEIRGYRPFGAHLIRKMFFDAPNISRQHPYTFSMMALSQETPGLDQSRFYNQFKSLKNELDKMVNEDLITHYDADLQYANTRCRGRPSPYDAEVTLYPGERWIKAVKSASKRQMLSEQVLGLPRSQRSMRQQNLPL